jgi:multimeric flavodoxin WrbA
MKLLIISGNPKKDGLCRAVTNAIISGAKEGGAEVEEISMDGMTYCRVCGNGTGICGSEKKCKYGGDRFTAVQDSIRKADALAIITPVYWGEESDRLKSFLDRLRRCEPDIGPWVGKGLLHKKPTLLIASAGGSGVNYLTALEQLDRFCSHTGAAVFDEIGIHRWNNDYKRKAVFAAAKAMVSGRKVGETIANDS